MLNKFLSECKLMLKTALSFVVGLFLRSDK